MLVYSRAVRCSYWSLHVNTTREIKYVTTSCPCVEDSDLPQPPGCELPSETPNEAGSWERLLIISGSCVILFFWIFAIMVRLYYKRIRNKLSEPENLPGQANEKEGSDHKKAALMPVTFVSTKDGYRQGNLPDGDLALARFYLEQLPPSLRRSLETNSQDSQYAAAFVAKEEGISYHDGNEGPVGNQAKQDLLALREIQLEMGVTDQCHSGPSISLSRLSGASTDTSVFNVTDAGLQLIQDELQRCTGQRQPGEGEGQQHQVVTIEVSDNISIEVTESVSSRSNLSHLSNAEDGESVQEKIWAMERELSESGSELHVVAERGRVPTFVFLHSTL